MKQHFDFHHLQGLRFTGFAVGPRRQALPMPVAVSADGRSLITNAREHVQRQQRKQKAASDENSFGRQESPTPQNVSRAGRSLLARMREHVKRQIERKPKDGVR